MKNQKLKRKIRVRAKVVGVQGKHRLTVNRSNKHIYAQVIDDLSGRTVCTSSDKDLSKSEAKESKIKQSFLVGEKIAVSAKKKKISRIVFDKGEYKYHGRVKSLADGARKGGLVF